MFVRFVRFRRGKIVSCKKWMTDTWFSIGIPPPYPGQRVTAWLGITALHPLV